MFFFLKQKVAVIVLNVSVSKKNLEKIELRKLSNCEDSPKLFYKSKTADFQKLPAKKFLPLVIKLNFWFFGFFSTDF